MQVAYDWIARRRGALTPDRLFSALLLAVGIVALTTFGDYGVTWDEDLHAYYGELIIRYYTSLGADQTALTWWNLYIYGGAFDLPATLLTKISPLGYYETRHAFNATVGILGIVGTWKLARALAGPRAGLIAALLLTLTPNYFGHMFNNPKDIPFAVGMAWGTYYLVLILREMPHARVSLALRFGLALGLTAGVRIGGVLLFAYLGLAIVALSAWRGLAARSIGETARHGALSGLRTALPALAVAYPVMLLFWPYAQQSPVANPLAALRDFSHHAYGYQVLFDGAYYWASDLPWLYLPTYILLKLPELHVALLALAIPVAIYALATSEVRRRLETVAPIALVAFTALFPIVYAIAIHATVFNGMRHFMFVLPPLIVIAAIVLDSLIDQASRGKWPRLAAAGLAIYLGFHATQLARLHPNEYVYYNAFVGGVEGAQGLFKLDYWGNSYAEAVRGLEHTLRERYAGEFEARTFKIRICGPKVSARYYFPPNFVEAENDREADFVISMLNYAPASAKLVEIEECKRIMAGEQIYGVERENTLLSVVIDRRALKIETAERIPKSSRASLVP